MRFLNVRQVKETDEPNVGIITQNPDPSVLTETDNTFNGRFTERVRSGKE